VSSQPTTTRDGGSPIRHATTHAGDAPHSSLRPFTRPTSLAGGLDHTGLPKRRLATTAQATVRASNQTHVIEPNRIDLADPIMQTGLNLPRLRRRYVPCMQIMDVLWCPADDER